YQEHSSKGGKMKFRAPKNQLLFATIVVGAIAIAVPLSIFGIIGVLWRAFKSWARPNRPVVSKKKLGDQWRQLGPGLPVSRLELPRRKKIRPYTSEIEATGHALAFRSISPEVPEPIRRHLGVADRMHSSLRIKKPPAFLPGAEYFIVGFDRDRFQ